MITVILSNQLWNIIIWSKTMATDVFTLNRIVFMPNHFLHINRFFGEGRQCIGKAFEGLLVLCTLQLQAYKENRRLIKHAQKLPSNCECHDCYRESCLTVNDDVGIVYHFKCVLIRRREYKLWN